MFHRRNSAPTSSLRRSPQLVLAVLLGAGLVAAAPGAAQAKTVTDKDKAKDVVRVDSSTEEMKEVPRFRQNDVMSTKLIHTSDKVGVKMTLAELKKAGHLSWLLVIEPAKGEGGREVSLQAGEEAWSGVLSVSDSETHETVDCGKHDIDYKDDVVSITLPRDCVGAGKWVKFRALAVTYNDKGAHGDDAIRDRPLKSSDTVWGLSGRVYK